jgi:hypothetical protein
MMVDKITPIRKSARPWAIDYQHNRAGERVIAGLDEALRHSRGEIPAKEHRIPCAATNDQGMILGEPVDLYESFSHEPIRDPAVGGRGGLVFMLLVAFLIGAMLALGGVL